MTSPSNSQKASQDLRLSLLTQWLQNKFSGDFTIEPASADASFRRYFRVHHNNYSVIAVDAPPDKEDNERFVLIAKKLNAIGLHVPTVIDHNFETGFLLLSDLGKMPYLQVLNNDSVDKLYGGAINAIITMQTRAKTQSLTRYDETLLHNEMQLFKDWFLNQHLQIMLNREDNQTIATTFDFLQHSALEQPCFFVHRDYHSRNLMYCGDKTPGILDFQDAVIGPLTYDLASLLMDCYIQWPRARIKKWLEIYRQDLIAAGGPAISQDQLTVWFDLMAMQRHLKAIGIFARLNHRDQKPGYLADIPRTLNYIFQTCERYPSLGNFLTLLRKYQLDAYSPQPQPTSPNKAN